MEEIKDEISKLIVESLDIDISKDEIKEKIEIPKDSNNGDFAYPCFNLAKILKNSPINIANDIKSKINLDDNISKVEVVNGYLNFYLKSDNIINGVLTKLVNKGENIGNLELGNSKNVVIDYSSPNIAKPFHLGHFRNTVLGSSIYNLYKTLGYNVIGVNHLGDWGRQFGLLIEGYKRFRDEYDIDKDPIHVLADMYVRISKLAKEDETVMDIARDNFKKLEQGDEEYNKLWKYFREVSLKEYNRIYDLLGSKFDSYNGEAFYKDKTDEIIKILENKGVLVESQNAKVVNVGEDIPPCIVLKSNGSTIYATRDLAAILYRVRTYDYYKNIYVTASDQILHFKQIFEASKYLVDEKYKDGLVHVPYGMVRLKTGKMSTREGTVIYIDELITEAIEKAKKIIEEKNSNINDIEKVSRQVGIGALIFNYLKSSKIKDIVFDLDDTLKFDGETGPYIQYTYVRTKSILEKLNFKIENIDISDIDLSILNKEEEINLVKKLDEFEEIIKKAADEYEPSVLAHYLIELSSLFSKFYINCQVQTENENLKLARCILVYVTGTILKKGLSIFGIEAPDKM